MFLSVSENCFMRCTSVSSTFRFLQDKPITWLIVLFLFFSWNFAWIGEGGGAIKVDCNCKLLSLDLLQLFSCKNAISSKYLHFGKEDAAAPDFVVLECLSRHFFRLFLRFFCCFCKYSSIKKNSNKWFTKGLAASIFFSIFICFNSNLI